MMSMIVRFSHAVKLFLSQWIVQFFVFLPFHPTVLKPDFDLSLRQAKRLGDLAPSRTAKILVKVKLFL